MSNFVLGDAPHDLCRPFIASGRKTTYEQRGYVQAARFQHHRDDGQPGERIAGSMFRCLPQAVMCGQISIVRAIAVEPPLDEGEVDRFLGADPQPLVDEVTREVGTEPTNEVEGKVDGDIFDVSERMQHSDAGTR